MKKYEPKYLKVYSKHIIGIFGLPKAAQRVLGYILDNMNDDNQITIAGGGRTKLITEVGIKPQTLSNALHSMHKVGLLFSEYKGVYVVNPEIFSMKKQWGDVLNQRKKFRATIEYSGDTEFKIRGNWK